MFIANDNNYNLEVKLHHECVFSNLYLHNKGKTFNEINIENKIRSISACNYYVIENDKIVFICGKVFVYSLKEKHNLKNSKNILSSLQSFDVETEVKSSKKITCPSCNQKLSQVYLRMTLPDSIIRYIPIGLKLCTKQSLLYKVTSYSEVSIFK